MSRNSDVVLAVDDAADNLNMVAGLLGGRIKVKVARNGQKALAIAESDPPDLILLDVMMPEMDGYEVIKRLKSNPATKDIPVIFLTARSEVEDEAQGFTLGAVDYISKPFNPLIVKARVNTHLELVRQRRRTEELLAAILPRKVIDQLKETGTSAPESFDQVSLLFSDIVGFTPASSGLTPEFLISELSSIFTSFDQIMAHFECERIKTIGDAYFAVCGMPRPDPMHARKLVAAGLDCIRHVKTRNESSRQKWEIRVGVHTGPVVGGIVGIDKYLYDVFGDAVNMTSRVETSSEPMRLSVSEETYKLVQDDFLFTPRGTVDLKGKGAVPLYFVDAAAW